MFLPCECIFFCEQHAEMYLEYNIGSGFCPDSRFIQNDGKCHECIDQIVNLIVHDKLQSDTLVTCIASDYGIHEDSDDDDM